MYSSHYDGLFESRKKLIDSILNNIKYSSKTAVDIHGNKTSYNIAICGSYGSGKSYFIESFCEKLKQEDKKILIVKINAWQDDFLDDPILSIGTQIANEINKHSKKDGSKFNFNEFIEKVSKVSKTLLKKGIPLFAKGIINYAISKASVKEKTKELVKEITSDINLGIESVNEEINNNFINYKENLNQVKTFLNDYVTKNGKEIYIFVDELDRCKPDYAVEFLEAINHIFDIEGLVFIFGIDRRQLESAIKVIYGHGLNFDSYLKKFIHYEFTLANKDEENDKRRFITSKLSKDKTVYHYDESLIQSLTNFTLKTPLRNIESIVRCFTFFRETVNYHDNARHIACLIFLISLRDTNEDLFFKLFDTNGDSLMDIDIQVLLEIFKSGILNSNNNILIGGSEKFFNELILIEGVINRHFLSSNSEYANNIIDKLFLFKNYLNDEKAKKLEILIENRKNNVNIIDDFKKEFFPGLVNSIITKSELKICFDELQKVS